MTDFEPTTDFPDSIEDDDTPVRSEASLHDETVLQRRKQILLIIVAAVTIGLLALGYPILRVAIAVAAFYALIRVGFAVLGSFARPIPEPPPPGELRKVKLVYRCSSCGAELRMTLANDQMPDPPRHCADDMDLMTPVDDLY